MGNVTTSTLLYVSVRQMSPRQSQVGGVDGVQLGRSGQRDRRVRGALRAVEPA